MLIAMLSLLQSIEATALATWLRTGTWAYPVLEIVHIFALGTVIGTLVLVDAAVIAGRDVAASRLLARQALPLTWVAFGAAAVTGLAMFGARATDLGFNRALWIKLALIACAGLNAGWFHLRDSLGRRDTVARLQALGSLGIWLAVVCAGRLIAYL